MSSTSRHRSAGSLLALIGMAGLAVASASAANLQDLVVETQRSAQRETQTTMAWWMPQKRA
jgi:hypothetical protein